MDDAVKLERLAREARAHLDEAGGDADAIARARGKFLAATRTKETRSRRSPRALLFAAAIAIAVVAAIGVASFRARVPPPLSFTVGGAPGVVGGWIAARDDAPTAVSFSDGSTVVLDGASSARIVGVDPHGAELMIERGVLHASIVHTGTSHWKIGAGPYEVRVTGTTFDVAWDPTTRAFMLTLVEGSVVVDGCALGERVVTTGQSVRDVCASKKDAPSLAPTTASSVPAPSISPPVAPSVSVSIAPSASAIAIAPKPAIAPPPAWNALAHAGDFKGAYAIVRDDFTARCADADADALLLLADVARYAGDPSRAKEAWIALRNRFPGDARAAAAAFFLGRAAFDEGAVVDAARWFETSLHEAPAGTFACEAAGRLIEARRRADDRVGAKEAARAYLQTCPNGPHAALAKTLAGE